jgi:hypothetical protein
MKRRGNEKTLRKPETDLMYNVGSATCRIF